MIDAHVHVFDKASREFPREVSGTLCRPIGRRAPRNSWA